MSSRHRDGDSVSRGRGKHRPLGEVVRAFFRLVRPQRRRLELSLALLTLATVLKLAPPVATKLAIDHALGGAPLPPEFADLPLPRDPFGLLVFLAIAVVITSLLAVAIHLWARWQATLAVQHVQIDVRRRAFRHALRLPLHRVYQLKSGGSASLVRYDAGGVGELIFSMLFNPWQAAIQLVGVLAVLLWVEWRLCLVGLLLAPIAYAAHRYWISRVRSLYRDIRAHRQHIDAQVTETFSGVRVVRAFGRRRSEENRFVKSINHLVRKQIRAWWWSRIIDVFWGLALPIASVSLLLYGGRLVINGDLSIGDLTMLLVYLAMMLGPLATLASSVTSFQDTLAGLDRLLDLFAERPSDDTRSSGRSVAAEGTAGQITLQNVSFRYPGATQLALDSVSLELPAGKTVALVGRSGSGKSTLSNLVARFYDPTSGAVRLDGVDLRELNCDDYRRLLAIVEQDVFLFDGTIGGNIAYGRRGASQAEIERAASAANADGFIRSLENGYDTLVGERGVQLSGGQRQRVAIARAILADPRILLLDEATSSVDGESEQLIQDAMASLMKGRTTLIIAHRMSSLLHADKIAVLDDGKLVEFGSHEELMALGGVYQRMFELQSSTSLSGVE